MKNTHTITLHLGECTVAVTGRHYRGFGGSHWEPPEPESFAVSSAIVTAKSGERFDLAALPAELLSEDALELLGRAALQRIRDEAEATPF